MSLTLEVLPRVFKYKEEDLVDPNNQLTPPEVLDFYSDTYPELVNSKLSGPIVNNGVVNFEFTSNFKEKG